MTTTAQATKLQSTTKPNVTAESVTIDELPILTNVWVDDTRVHFDLEDGRSIAWPISWSSLLTKATPEQRQQFSYSAYHVFWDTIDEIIGVKNVLYPSPRLTNSVNKPE
ncbi:DUF2442 domain-containing protein [Spirosoma sp. KNUC1025]|uniref:DUF2442 domain-containing protein n=1 Tax=Spirosoma sp. KNUC1025 TaxID=2894082 RepID=UPI00386A7B0A|nr:DUF2442 domain-containing protein [Spirosoma sp. KNUC1025]